MSSNLPKIKIYYGTSCEKDNNLEITGDGLSEDEFEKYFSPASLTETFETTNYKEIPAELLPFLNTERLVKKFEGQVVLPLKKRRKLSQFSDNASIKDDDIQYLDSQRIHFDNNRREVYVTGMKNDVSNFQTGCNISYPSTPMLSIASIKDDDIQYLDSQRTHFDNNREVYVTGMKNDVSNFQTRCNISYPSTPMLSIANFENTFFCPQHKRFKTPAQLKEIAPSVASVHSVVPVARVAPVASVAPVSSISTMTSSSVNNPVGAMNLQTFNILSNSTPHAINVLQSQQTATVVNNAGGVAGNVQTFNIMPSQGAGINMSRNNGNIQNIQQNDMNNVNVNFNLGNHNDLSTIQAFINSNSLQYTQAFHPNPPQYTTYSIRSNPQQNQINLQSLCDIQGFINLSNYQMNPQHLSNFLHNSQINLQAKQAVLLNDLNIPCNLHINASQQNCYQNKNNPCKSNISDSNNGCHNSTKKCCGECKVDSSSSSSSLMPISSSSRTGSTRGRSREKSNQGTDRITRSSNRTSVVNYKDKDVRPVGLTSRKRKSSGAHKK